MRDRDERPLCLGLSKNWNEEMKKTARAARRQRARGIIEASVFEDSLASLAAEVEAEAK